MKKNIAAFLSVILIIILSLFSFKGYSQNYHLVNPDIDQLAFTSSDELFRINARRVFTDKSDLNDGSAFLYTTWRKGIVNFKNGKQFRDADLEFNIVKNELYFKRDGVANSFLEPVTSFCFFDTSATVPVITVFRNGYPLFGEHTSGNFYHVLSMGPEVHFIKYISKTRREVYEYGGVAKWEYISRQDAFLYDVKANALHLIRYDMQSIKNAIPAYAAGIEKWLKENKKRKSLSDEELIEITSQINKQQLPGG